MKKNIRAAFEKFRGDFYQMPPMVSAIKQGGVPLYKLARQGKVVEREPRLVHVYRYSIDRIALPEIDFTVVCSKGFYVRTYAHDIGETLGCGAHLEFAATSEIGAVRCRERDLGRSDQKWRPVRNCRAGAFVAAGFPDAGSVRGMTKLGMTNDEGSPNDELRKDARTATMRFGWMAKR